MQNRNVLVSTATRLLLLPGLAALLLALAGTIDAGRAAESLGVPQEVILVVQNASKPLTLSAAKVGPKIKFDTKFVDFGNLPIDRLAPYAFVFRNVGDAPLRITNKFIYSGKKIHNIKVKVLKGC